MSCVRAILIKMYFYLLIIKDNREKCTVKFVCGNGLFNILKSVGMWFYTVHNDMLCLFVQ